VTPKPRRPRADVVARRFKRGESVEVMAAEIWNERRFSGRGFVSFTECREEVEDALRRSMNRGRRA